MEEEHSFKVIVKLQKKFFGIIAVFINNLGEIL